MNTGGGMALRDPADVYRALVGLETPQPANIVGLPSPNEPNNYYITPRGFETLIDGSRIERRDRFGRSSNWASTDRPGPARGAERAEAQADALLRKVLGNRSGLIKDSEVADLDRAASLLLGEEPVGRLAADDSISENERTGAFTSEDPTEYQGRRQSSGDINPYYAVEVPAGIPQEDGRVRWGDPNAEGFRPVLATLDPYRVVETRTQNPRRLQGTRGGFAGDSDNTAAFLREKQITAGELVKEALDATKTPVITKSALEAARAAGRARAVPADERDRNLVGYMIPPGQTEEVPVYAVTDGAGGKRKTTKVLKPSPDDPLRNTELVDEEYFRVGRGTNRDETALREEIRQIFGIDPTQGEVPAPLLENTWDRLFAEKKLKLPRSAGQVPSLENFAKELSGGGFMQDPGEAPSVYKSLAKALITGELEVAGDRPFTKRSIPVDPEAILSLAGPDGRPLFAPGSNAQVLLGQAVAELRGGREVDLFPEPQIDDFGADSANVGRGEAPIINLLRELQGRDGATSPADAASELFGFDPEARSADDSVIQGRYGDFGDAPGGVSIKTAPTEPIDTLDRAAIALTGDVGQGLYLADVARRSAAPGRASGTNAYGTTVGPIAESPAKDPMAVLLELTGRRSPVESTPGPQQVRRKYQGDFASTSGRGQPVTGQSGYARMAEGLGGQPGLPQNEKAMALLAQRIRERATGGTPAAPDPADVYRAQKLTEFGGVSPRERYLGGGPLADYLGHGSAPGSWMHDRAMGMSTQRIQQRVQAAAEDQAATDMAAAVPQKAAMVTPKQSMFNAPAPAPTPQDAEAMDRQAALERLQLRREGFAGPRAGRILQNFGNVG